MVDPNAAGLNLKISVDCSAFDTAIDYMLKRLEEVAVKATKVGIKLDVEIEQHQSSSEEETPATRP